MLFLFFGLLGGGGGELPKMTKNYVSHPVS